MEACMMKPDVKKKTKPPKAPPAEIKRNDPEKPAPVVPARPADAELSHTQYRTKRAATNNEELNTPTRYSQRRRVGAEDTESSKDTEQPEDAELPRDEPDFKQSVTAGMFRRSQKEKTPTFTGVLKGVMKELQFKLSPKASREPSPDPSAEEAGSEKGKNAETKGAGPLHGELSASSDKEKGSFSGLLRGTPETAREIDVPGSSDSLSEAASTKQKKGGLTGIFDRSASIDNMFDEEKSRLFSGLKKKTPKASGDEEAAEDKDSQKELFPSDESLSERSDTKEKTIFSEMFKKTQKPADEESNAAEGKKLSSSCQNLLESSTAKENSGGLAGIFRKSPKPAPRSVAAQDPLSDSQELSASWDNLAEIEKGKKDEFAGMFRRTPTTVEQQESEDLEPPQGGSLRRRSTIKKRRRVVSFRVKKTLPGIPKINQSQSSDKMPVVEETVELQELRAAQPVEIAAYPTGDNPAQAEQESDELMEWWYTVAGWTEWNEVSNFQVEDEDMVVEQVADRVYMAARLFVRLFNQQGASLQHRILELVALADAADHFHKKTVTVAVGGGVASVAGSVTTITGLILAPFTFGASIIVTAVGISVATAGSITSATANITDTVHSNLDRKKVEKMIQGYQEEIKDIRECLEFVQEGLDTLQKWDFEKYSQSAAKKALNHNIKHVVKEGGRAGKALMINTHKLISTVQLLGAAGGAAKAAKAISVTTGVMSALFLALDVFFLAKNSHELHKGAKTKFACKIREVCKDLQDGLLELNKVKTQLQKTMDGIEVEEYEEIEEVEVEVEDDLESDPKKLAELEQELDLLEETLDKKVEEEKKKSKEMEKKKINEKKEEKNIKEKEESEEKKKKEKVEESGVKMEKDEGHGTKKEQKQEIKSVKTAKQEVLKEQKGGKKDKETENRITAGEEKHESPQDKMKEDAGPNQTTEKEKNKEEVKSRSEDSKQDNRSVKTHSEKVKTERESQRSRSSRGDERWAET
ncbi:uncharacterized protein LOC114449332 isoform X3 [Parambassis ranga]|uniref:Uncharacterized protein LOC114449332 isoform X3 n=1 Tax=Parambassis ranga TaxID=210632 RepID=A0A6P7K4X9_9TELE|nr:uncharacterized protein LOC114449332 isoform X3 [Parambassis ranga]